MANSRKPLDKVLRTKLVDDSVLSTIYLGVSSPGPWSMLEAVSFDEERNLDEYSTTGYWYETCLITVDDIRVLRRHKTEAEAIVWHEEYLDNVLYHWRSA